jgi:triacylglycerol lipase
MSSLVFLVPGFFGFTRAGALTYFQGVESTLARALERRRIDARIVSCRTQPTASIRRRAERLIDVVRDAGGLDADALHFVGHSTGGLDARLLTTPGVRLRSDAVELSIMERTRSVVTVSTPHYGTPLAGIFTTLPGRQLLGLLALLSISRGGRLGLVAAAHAIGLAARFDDVLDRDQTFLDFLAHSPLQRVTREADAPLWGYLREIARDQGAVLQLTPESMDLFNAAVVDSPGIEYASLVTAAPPPPRKLLSRDLLSLAHAVLAGGFTVLYAIASRENRHYRYPHPGADALRVFDREPSLHLTASSNDGVVPAFSQVYGRVLGLVVADHLDVVGQFFRSGNPYSDWLPSGSHFDSARFEYAWDRVAEHIAGADVAQARSLPEGADRPARSTRPAGRRRAERP